MSESNNGAVQFIDVFDFKPDKSKPGRTLETAKIGDVYMSRLVIDPGITTGNYFHKKTRKMFYAGGGEILAAFEHVKTKQRKEMTLEYAKQVIHVPPNVAIATKNIGYNQAILIFFSDRPLRDEEDTFPYHVL